MEDRFRRVMPLTLLVRSGGARRHSVMPTIWVQIVGTATTRCLGHVREIFRSNIKLGAAQLMAALSGFTTRWSVACFVGCCNDSIDRPTATALAYRQAITNGLS